MAHSKSYRKQPTSTIQHLTSLHQYNALKTNTMMSTTKFTKALILLFATASTLGHAITVPTFTSSNTYSTTTTTTALNAAYVPDGLTAEQIKQNEKPVKSLGRLRPRGFKSRSMTAWQQACEKGQAGHAFAPPVGFWDKVKAGKMKMEDVPCMVRGGSWDNSDVKGAKTMAWLQKDREYARGGYKKEQSASILGSGPVFDWAATRARAVNLKNKIVPGLS